MDDGQRRREVLAESEYLEARSHAIVRHSQELIARAQRLRGRMEQQLLDHAYMQRGVKRTPEHWR